MTKFDNLPKNTSKQKNYDTTLFRLIEILRKISANEMPTIKELSVEFNVSERTIQRDIKRLQYFPIEKNANKQLYFVDGFTLDKSTLDNDEMLFVYLSMSQVKSMSSSFGTKIDTIFSKLLNPGFSTPYHIKNRGMEKIDTKSKLFQIIESTIQNNYIANLKTIYVEIDIKPYKIISLRGIWYLLARDLEDNKIKTFIISDIKKYKNTYESFKLETNIEEVLNHVHSGWFDDGNRFEVKILVKKNISKFFKAKMILPTQEIIEEKTNGDLIISFYVSHYEDIDNLIKAWMPEIYIISPKEYKDHFESEMKKYISSLQNYKAI